MKIGFYIHHTAISAGGIFTYSIGILRQIISAAEIEKIVIITSREIQNRLNEFSGNPKVKIKIVNRNKPLIKLDYFISYLIYNLAILIERYALIKSGILKNLSTFINPYHKALEAEDISLLHVPVQYSPVYNTKIPVIITMHDLQEYHYPEFFSTREKRHRKINNKKAIFDSDHIIVSFNHVKNDIVKFFRVNEGKISVCSPPFAESWFLSKKETGWDELSKKYRLKKNYLLYPAATWKHKNHIMLIRVLKSIKDEGIDIDLVCTGNRTNYLKNIKTIIEEFNLSGIAHFLGIVPEEDLIGLYKNTSLVVIPTLYEAGSGPLYEAMRFGVPVICSNVTSLPETMRNDEFLFDPNDQNEIKEKIIKGLSDENFRLRNLQNSKNRMVTLNQSNYYNSFVKVYKQFDKN
ncbi:MAG: glycosyltransferase family 1 protein [Candidatus Lokiarchaeia archaeon]|nr:glycosyltransferase family 1 protein [Candidatus Lokiarchaeia archaeon]